SATSPGGGGGAARGNGPRGLSAFPLAAQGPVSAALGRAGDDYRVVALRARNPAQRLRATFSPAGARVASGSATIGLRLDGYGRGGQLRRVGKTVPRVAANRVDYAHDSVGEWYANGPLGLEHGFDINARPAGTSGPLTLSLALSGNLRPRLDRAGAVFEGAGNALRYGGLQTSDARGRALHSWFELRGGRLAIRVDDHRAAYPVRVDPIVQQAKLTARDGVAGDAFSRVAIDGDTIAVGAPGRNTGGNARQGAVYVFEKPAAGWAHATQTAVLTASDGATESALGGAVAISGDTIVAGASGHKVGAHEFQGAAYVFVRPASGWTDGTQAAELTASDGAASDGLGGAVAISGDTIVAGPAQHTRGGHFRQGEAYLFSKPVAGWADAPQTTTLFASDGAEFDGFGGAISISHDTVVVGAPNHQVGDHAQQGAAYVFIRPSLSWTNAEQSERTKLSATDGGATDQFGSAVAISGDTVVVGSPNHEVDLARQGAAYVFLMPLNGWGDTATQTAELTASDGVTGDKFGSAVAATGETVLASSFLHQVGGNAAQGAVYLFAKPSPTWKTAKQTTELTAGDGAALDLLGLSVAISGSVTVAAGGLRGENGEFGAGAAYLFGPPPEIAIRAPANGATFTQGQAIAASYSCSAPAGATITSCTGPVADGAAIDTTASGSHVFTITASDSDGLTATESVSYSVLAAGKVSGTLALTHLRQAASVWRRGGGLARIGQRRKPPIGTSFTFDLSGPARVTLAFTRAASGRRVRGRCVKQTTRNARKPSCRRAITAGTVSFSAKAGANRIGFQGRLSRSKRLSPGRYTLRVLATDIGGQRATAPALRFTIVK
ncbi:MAG: FG-GAP repeat protein, partial [Solirubrobacteraceae bacterium]